MSLSLLVMRGGGDRGRGRGGEGRGEREWVTD